MSEDSLGSWEQYRKLVIAELERVGDRLERLSEDISKMREQAASRNVEGELKQLRGIVDDLCPKVRALERSSWTDRAWATGFGAAAAIAWSIIQGKIFK